MISFFERFGKARFEPGADLAALHSLPPIQHRIQANLLFDGNLLLHYPFPYELSPIFSSFLIIVFIQTYSLLFKLRPLNGLPLGLSHICRFIVGLQSILLVFAFLFQEVLMEGKELILDLLLPLVLLLLIAVVGAVCVILFLKLHILFSCFRVNGLHPLRKRCLLWPFQLVVNFLLKSDHAETGQ